MRAERRAKRVNRARKAKMRSQLQTIWLAVLGNNSQQGVKLPPRMHLVRQILGHTVWVERAIAIACLLLFEGNGVRVFCFQFSRNKQQNSYVAACLSLPSYTCTSSASNFTTCLRQNVNSVCCLGLQRCKAVSLHNH